MNNVTYEHDNEHSNDLAKEENYLHRGAEVNTKPVTVYNVFYRPFRPILFVIIVFEQNRYESQGRSKLSIEVPVCHLGLWIRFCNLYSLQFD